MNFVILFILSGNVGVVKEGRWRVNYNAAAQQLHATRRPEYVHYINNYAANRSIYSATGNINLKLYSCFRCVLHFLF